jgi:hypothetical protein
VDVWNGLPADRLLTLVEGTGSVEQTR